MKNITVSVPEETYRRARVRAAEQGKSLSALVAEYLETLGARDGEFRRLEALERAVISEITGFSASENVPREALYDRAVR